MEQLISQLLFAVKELWKYRWYSVASAWVVVAIGFVTVYALPSNYESSARVYVDTQTILKPLLSGMTTIPDVEQQVSIMSRTLLSRPNIERVMRMVDLDLSTHSIEEKEAVASKLMKDIKIGGTSRNDIYTISYNNANAKLAKDVVQSLLTIFIESSFGDKKQDSANAIRFIDDQIKQVEGKLQSTESAIKDFKLKNLGMSGKEGGFGGALASAEDLLSQSRLDLTEAEQARNAIKREIAGESPVGAGNATSKVFRVDPEIEARIQLLNKTLDTYRLQFTEEHPDIVATKRVIEQLRTKATQDALAPAATSGAVIGKNYSPVLQQLKVALSEAEARVASMRARVNEYTVRVTRMNTQATAAPGIEAQFAQLNRDYETNKLAYEKLLTSRDAAKLSGDLSATSEMISFRIIDPPTIPTKPIGPNRPRLFSLASAVALALGLAIAFFIAKARPTFVSLAQLREISGLPVLGSISMNWSKIEQKQRGKEMATFIASLVGLLVLFGGGLLFFLVTP